MRRSALCILLFLCVATAPFAVSPPRKALVAIDAAPGALVRLLDADICVVRDLGRHLIAFATTDDLDQIRHLGFTPRILDANTVGKTFHLVHAASPASRDRLRDRFQAMPIDAFTVIVEIPSDRVGELFGEHVEIARVFDTPMRPARATNARRRALFTLPVPRDSIVQALVDSISITRIDARVERLQDFGTRHALSDSGGVAAQYVKEEFEQAGIDSVRFHEWDTRLNPNVVAVLPGVATPQNIIVLGGHYDSASRSPSDPASGADDNASGTSGVLECARWMARVPFENTIVFVAFGAEEIGLLGSEAYAAEAVARGDSIVAMINMDMIGYVRPGDAVDIDIVFNTSSQWLRDLVSDAGSTYVPGFGIVDGTLPVAFSSDHSSFWRHGYDAVYFFEDSDSFSPFIHSDQDVIGLSYQSPGLAEHTVKLAVATVATLAVPHRATPPVEPPVPPGDITIAQNYPNPFNPNTTIRVSVPGRSTRATLNVYDAAGRLVATLLANQVITGERNVAWDGRDRQGRLVSSGVYFYQLTSPDATISRKMVVVR